MPELRIKIGKLFKISDREVFGHASGAELEIIPAGDGKLLCCDCVLAHGVDVKRPVRMLKFSGGAAALRGLCTPTRLFAGTHPRGPLRCPKPLARKLDYPPGAPSPGLLSTPPWRCQQPSGQPLIEAEQVLGPLPVASEWSGLVQAVHSVIEDLVRLAKVGRHHVRIIEVC